MSSIIDILFDRLILRRATDDRGCYVITVKQRIDVDAFLKEHNRKLYQYEDGEKDGKTHVLFTPPFSPQELAAIKARK